MIWQGYHDNTAHNGFFFTKYDKCLTKYNKCLYKVWRAIAKYNKCYNKVYDVLLQSTTSVIIRYDKCTSANFFIKCVGPSYARAFLIKKCDKCFYKVGQL